MAINNFKETEAFYKFIKTKISFELGHGREGTCYKGIDNQTTYKVYKEENGKFYSFDTLIGHLNISDIITRDELNLASFAFPTELYTIKNKTLAAYKYDFIENFLISEENIDKLNTSPFSKAYYQMLKDVDVLSEKNILINDLSENILFDGETLTAIDTCIYQKDKDYASKYNRGFYNNAIEKMFENCFNSKKVPNVRIESNNIDKYLDEIKSFKKICK